MDVGGLIILAVGVSFVALVVLAIRKLGARSLDEPHRPKEILSPEEQALEDEALASTHEDTGATTPRSDIAAQPSPLGVSSDVAPSAVEPSARSMRRGLEKTRKGFIAQINQLLFKELDASLVDELESVMITSDVGIRTTSRLLGDLRDQLSRREIQSPEIVRQRMRDRVRGLLRRPDRPIEWDKSPTVMMVIGVNGVGKTTTIGKLAARLTRDGKKVVLAAGDTFRAAAVEQLEIWGERSGAVVVRGAEGADPASVVFEAIQRARSMGAHACICDTAGRLHTKINLMEELKKLRRVMSKAQDGAPHEVMMVLDATTGQNAIAQARQFKEAVEVNSIALTKLDGTAKGGVVVAICDELALPVRYVGIGEKIEDLRDFDPDEFVDALFLGDEGENGTAPPKAIVH